MPKTTITVALICHDDWDMYVRKLAEIKAWSRQPDELLIYASEPWPASKPWLPVRQRPDKDDKGYDKRHHAYMEAAKDWVYCVNYDDIHDFHVLELLEAATRPDSTVVYHKMEGKYAANDIDGTSFVPYKSGAENFMVRTSIARQVGGYAPYIGDYKSDNTGSPPDLKFIHSLKNLVELDTIEYVPETLVVVL